MGEHGEPTSVVIEAHSVQTMVGGTHQNLSWCSFICNISSLDGLTLKKMKVGILQLTGNLTTAEGLYISHRFLAKNVVINSGIYLGGSSMQLTNSSLYGNVELSEKANLQLFSSSLVGNITAAEASEVEIESSNIMGNVAITSSSNASVHNGSVIGNFTNSATLEISNMLNVLGNYIQTKTGKLVFKRVDFYEQSHNSSNQLIIDGQAYLNGILGCEIINTTESNMTKKILLIDSTQGVHGNFNSSRFMSAGLFNTTHLQIHKNAKQVKVGVVFNIVNVYFLGSALGIAMVGAAVFLFVTRNREQNENGSGVFPNN